MKRTVRSVVLFLCIICSVCSCAPLVVGLAVGAGTVGYVKGEFVQNFDEPMARLFRASLSALRSVDAMVSDDEILRDRAMIAFTLYTGKKGKLYIKKVTENSSRLVIRIGTFGDEAHSRMVVNAIQKKL